jgi:hypothetical protein
LSRRNESLGFAEDAAAAPFGMNMEGQQEEALAESVMPADGTLRCPLLGDDFGMSRFKGR